MNKHYKALEVSPHRIEICGPGLGDVLPGFPCGLTVERMLRLLEDAYSAAYGEGFEAGRAAGVDATMRTVVPDGSCAVPASPAEPKSIADAREAVARFARDGVCPAIDRASHGSLWTCRECDRSVPATLVGPGSALERRVVRCRLLPPDGSRGDG